ncbi:MAG: tetratricopeptide repeat protein, partial [Pseudobdellovibrionaceae bacterium]
YNSAVLYESLGNKTKALKKYEEFLAVSKKYRDNLDVSFAMAQLYRQQNQNSYAIQKYQDYLQGANDRDKIIESYYWLTELYKKQGRKSESEEWHKKTLLVQRRFSPNNQGVGAEYAAKLSLQDSFKTFSEFKAIRFPADPVKQKAAADKKLALLTQLNKELSNVIKYNSANEIISSLSLLGQANQNMAETIIATPLPTGLNAEQTVQYKEGVKKFAEPFTNKTIESFKAAVDRAWELQTYNEDYKLALSYLSQKDSKNYYNGEEAASDIRLVNWAGQKNE